MRRPTSTAQSAPALARLTFNVTAARDYFASAKGLRVRIDRGVIGFYPSKKTRGADILMLEFRPRGDVRADIISDGAFDETLAQKLLQRLFKMGLTEDAPYFCPEPLGRGWLGLSHIADRPAQRMAALLITGFEPPPPPPIAVNVAEWRSFHRLLESGDAVEDLTWARVHDMIRDAMELVAQPRRGRVSQKRTDAIWLIDSVHQSADLLDTLMARQPELQPSINQLLAELGLRNAAEPEADVEEAEAEGTETEEAEVAAESEPVVETEPEPELPLVTAADLQSAMVSVPEDVMTEPPPDDGEEAEAAPPEPEPPAAEAVSSDDAVTAAEPPVDDHVEPPPDRSDEHANDDRPTDQDQDQDQDHQDRTS